MNMLKNVSQCISGLTGKVEIAQVWRTGLCECIPKTPHHEIWLKCNDTFILHLTAACQMHFKSLECGQLKFQGLKYKIDIHTWISLVHIKDMHHYVHMWASSTGCHQSKRRWWTIRFGRFIQIAELRYFSSMKNQLNFMYSRTIR